VGTTSPFGGLDGIESDTTETHYYVTDNPAGKIYTVNADGTWYATLIEYLHLSVSVLSNNNGKLRCISPSYINTHAASYYGTCGPNSLTRNSRPKQSKTDDNLKKQMITMFFSKISEDIVVIHSKLYVRFRITKPASEKALVIQLYEQDKT
jgi:hypothetical protein